MILRKPYAFLIKYFKIIHIIMFIFFSYLVFSLRKIYMFFVNYIKTNNYIYFENMAKEYVTPIMFIMVFIILGAAIAIFLLMRKKEKPVLFYRVLILYSIVLIGVFIYFYSFFNSLKMTTYPPLRIVINRDIMLFVYIINFFYVGFTFIRGFGFDIKKFSFDRDKKELHLEETDNEEYEFNIGIDKENVANYIRKEKREFKYYLKENAFILSIIGSLIVIIIGLYIYFNFFVINKTYKQDETITISKISYKVNSSILTNLNKFDEVLITKNDLLILNINIINQLGDARLDKENFRVRVNEEYYYPNYNYCNEFSEIGTCYQNQKISFNTSTNYILIYKISKEYKEIYFEILKSKQGDYEYSKMLLSPKKINKKTEEIKINDKFTFNDKELTVSKYELLETTSYKYQDCVENDCTEYVKNIVPKLNDIVLVLNVNNVGEVDKDLLSNSISIRYDDKLVTSKDLNVIAQNNDILYISVPKSVMDSESLSFSLNTHYKEIKTILRSKNNE